MYFKFNANDARIIRLIAIRMIIIKFEGKVF